MPLIESNWIWHVSMPWIVSFCHTSHVRKTFYDKLPSLADLTHIPLKIDHRFLAKHFDFAAVEDIESSPWKRNEKDGNRFGGFLDIIPRDASNNIPYWPEYRQFDPFLLGGQDIAEDSILITLATFWAELTWISRAFQSHWWCHLLGLFDKNCQQIDATFHDSVDAEHNIWIIWHSNIIQWWYSWWNPRRLKCSFDSDCQIFLWDASAPMQCAWEKVTWHQLLLKKLFNDIQSYSTHKAKSKARNQRTKFIWV